MNYRLIFKDLLLKLTNKEAYTFCCILLNTDKETYISHIKEKTLVEMTGYAERGVFYRNTYQVKKPTINYFRVEYDFLLEDIPADIKGYLLLLKCIGYQGSNSVLYSLNRIAEKKFLNIGLSTIKKLNAEAIRLLVLSKEKTGYRITDRFIYDDQVRDNNPSDYQRYYNEIVCYCRKRRIIPPRYDSDLMYVIFNNCPESSFFFDKLDNREFTEKRIHSLQYFINVLGFHSMPKPSKEEYTFAMP